MYLVRKYICACACGGLGNWYRVLSSIILCYITEARALMHTELVDLARLTSQLAQSSLSLTCTSMWGLYIGCHIYLAFIWLLGVSNSCPQAYPVSSLNHLPKPTSLLLSLDVVFYLEYHYTLCGQGPPAQNHRGHRVILTSASLGVQLGASACLLSHSHFLLML